MYSAKPSSPGHSTSCPKHEQLLHDAGNREGGGWRKTLPPLFVPSHLALIAAVDMEPRSLSTSTAPSSSFTAANASGTSPSHLTTYSGRLNCCAFLHSPKEKCKPVTGLLQDLSVALLPVYCCYFPQSFHSRQLQEHLTSKQKAEAFIYQVPRCCKTQKIQIKYFFSSTLPSLNFPKTIPMKGTAQVLTQSIPKPYLGLLPNEKSLGLFSVTS